MKFRNTGVVLSLIVCAIILPGSLAAIAPSTQPDAPAKPNAEKGALKMLQRDFAHTFATSEGAGGPYILVRLCTDYYKDSVHGRIRYVLRATVNVDTGEITEVRGEYAEDEAALIDKRRPPGTLSVDAAIKIIDDDMHKNGMHWDAPSRIDIDLVENRYYLIRYANHTPQAPVKSGDLSPLYALHVVVDAKTGAILSQEMEPW
jgi:hypothetical protein